MEFRLATYDDYVKVRQAIGRKKIEYITQSKISTDYNKRRLYVVVDENKVVACASLVWEEEYEYFAIKRLCILNKKNTGKGIARFAIQNLKQTVNETIGATPWWDNTAMRHLLETEGFKLKYRFNGCWCYYWIEGNRYEKS